MRAVVVVALALVACKKPEPSHEPAPRPAPQPAPVVATPVAPAAVVDAPPGDAPAPPPVDARMQAYLGLLSADLYLDELLGTFPGAPSGTRFETDRYDWNRPREWKTRVEDVIDRAADGVHGRSEPVDQAVGAYVAVVREVMPSLEALYAYYDTRAFIDDEFDRARRELRDVAAWRAKIHGARRALWTSVLAAWRAYAIDVPGSPRATITNAWEACVRVGETIVMRGTSAARDAAISRCRRAIPSVSALPWQMRARYDETLRDTAAELGDFIARESTWSLYENADEIREITLAYLEMWPALPVTTAERPAAQAGVE